MVSVTPICRHEDGYTGSDEPITGHGLIINSEAVLVDRVVVLRRDRRMKKHREPGHRWIDNKGGTWTSFTIDYRED